MNDKNLRMVREAGFHMRPHLEGIQDGIDWSAASYGYEERLEELIKIVVQRCIAQVALVGLTNFEDDTTSKVCMEAIESIKQHFEVK